MGGVPGPRGVSSPPIISVTKLLPELPEQPMLIEINPTKKNSNIYKQAFARESICRLLIDSIGADYQIWVIRAIVEYKKFE